MVWYDKYRPENLSGYVFKNDDDYNIIKSWIDNPNEFPSLLVHGPSGTGKTTLAKIIMNNVDNASVRFIPASLRSGVETIRDEIVNFCQGGSLHDRIIIVLDEADRLSQDAQQMLRNVMDMFKDDVRFIFTCNYVEKIIDPLVGRMWNFEVSELDKDQYIDRIAYILEHEEMEIDDSNEEQILDIIDSTYPNMRKSISEIQKAYQNNFNSETKDDTGILEVIEQSPINIRKHVAQLTNNDYLDQYRVLYNNTDRFSNEHEAILVIADYYNQHNSSGLPEITLAACLLALKEHL